MKVKFHLLSIVRQTLNRRKKVNNLMDGNDVNDKPVIVYTDGSCRKPKAGVGVYFPGCQSSPKLEFSEPVEHPRSTNQVAELTACIRAIEIAKEKNIKNLLIRTDSQYVVNSMTDWIHKWKRNDWKRSNTLSDVKNRDLMQKLDSLCTSMQVEWEHVPREMNKVANDLAQKVTKTEEGKQAKEYKIRP